MSTIDDVKLRLDIVDTVSSYVQLKKSGRTFKGLCPFHTEKTPSFIVNPERQSWRCFGACATGGDVISFVMRAERMEFGEALRVLAKRAGVEISPRREGVYTINQDAARFYHDLLATPEGHHARRYLEERGVDSGAISTFQLGLSPAGGNRLKSHLFAAGFSIEQAVEAGLVHRGEGGATRDFFRGRLMFPIHDRQGRITGFGGRSLDGSPPKYLNTPGTKVFDKRNTLYALHLAAASIRAQKTGIVVEGYMDAIAAHQHGCNNVVASMGTALTEGQVSQLKSLATGFVLALDPDAAGQEATLRSLESSWHAIAAQAVLRHSSVGPLYRREGLSLKIAALPPGRDPDALIRENPKEWERLIRESVPLIEYILVASASRFDLTTGEGKAQAAEVVFPLIASSDNPFDQERYFRMLADTLNVTVASLEASIGRPRGRRPSGGRRRPGFGSSGRASVSPLSPERRGSLEGYTLALLLSRPELREQARDFAPEHFHRAEHREVFTAWLECGTICELRDSLDQAVHERLDQLIQLEVATADRQMAEAALAQCLRRLEERHLQELQETLLSMDDSSLPPPRDLEEPITSLNTRLKELFSQRS